MEDLKISVIVPMYNSEATIERCIKSLLNQSYKNIEIICIDDGSKDGSASIVERMGSSDGRIRLFKEENRGVSAARNNGLDKASGHYIMFADSDDYVDKDMLKRMMEAALSSHSDVTVCSIIDDYYEKGNLIKSSSHPLREESVCYSGNIADSIIDLFENDGINGPCGKLIKRSIIEDNGLRMPLNIHFQEDLYFNASMLKHVNTLYIMKECFYHYAHSDEESATSAYFKDKLEMLDAVHDEVVSYFETSTKDEAVIGRVYFFYVKDVFAGFMNLFHEKCTLTKAEKKEYIKEVINSSRFKEKMAKAERPGAKYKIIKGLLSIKSPSAIYCFSRLFHYLKAHFNMGY